MFIGVSLTFFRLGQYVSNCVDIDKKNESNKSKNYLLGAVVVTIVLGVLMTLRGGVYQTIVPVDIINKSDLIKESWYFWDDILEEVKTAAKTEGPSADVVIERENVEWCPYVYYVSLDDIPREPLGEDARYGRKACLKNISYPCEKIAIFIRCSVDEAKKRNSNRDRIVPDEVIDRMYANLIEPSIDEGFDEIINIDV